MNSIFGSLPSPVPSERPRALLAAVSAASVTIPHALGLGLLAYAPLAGQTNVAALALWSAAVPGALLSIAAPRPGVVYATTTVVAILFATAMLSVVQLASQLGLNAAQALAVSGTTVAIAFGFQWLFGALRLASLARFLPISVTHGFAAGVGLSMMLGQARSGFGSGQLEGSGRMLLHLGMAAAVMTLAVLVQRRWRRFPGLMPAVALMSVVAVVLGLGNVLAPAMQQSDFAWMPVPDWAGVPWLEVARAQGVQLVSLALLMAIVNSLDVVVFNQELELDHGVRAEPNAALRRESLVGVLCGLSGLLPASTSASRSRIALAQARGSASVGHLHAALMLAVAATGALWLPWVPMACLAGGLLLAGYNQIPAALWSRSYARKAPAIWSQSWMVALVFALAGGMGALVVGLVVATFVLLHASASTALRRTLLDGQLRSRRLRRSSAEAWLGERMGTVAVFELQGVISFGVAAHLAEQVRRALRPQHRRVVLDASRVASWDETALARVAALVRDLAQQDIEVVACGIDLRSAAQIEMSVVLFQDLDRALEWAEEAMLQERPPGEQPAAEDELLGELGEGMTPAGRRSLEALLSPLELPPHTQAFQSGDPAHDLIVVRSGRMTMSTAWPPSKGLRLATVGRGMAFGEMAFLSGQPRTACAGTEAAAASLAMLSRPDFDRWASEHGGDALKLMSNLAQIGTRRLAATTRQLRSVLE